MERAGSNQIIYLMDTGNKIFTEFAVISLSVLLCFLAACQNKDATIAGVTVPIPSQMEKAPDKVFKPVAGFEDGQAAYRGKVPPSEVFNFYQENMEARGWKPTNFMVTGQNQLAYTKEGRICLVWYTPNPDGTTTLTIMIGTSKPPG